MDSSKNRILYFIGFLIFTYFAVNFFESSYQAKMIKKYGVTVISIVSELPNCGRSSNTVYVEYNSKKYNINIGKNDCIQGNYKIGDRIKVVYSSSYDKMQLPTETVELGYWLSIAFFFIPLYFLYKLIKS